MNQLKLLPLLGVAFMCFGCGNESTNENNTSSSDTVVLSIYNCADYICETETDEDGNEVKGTLDRFIDYCKTEYDQNIEIKYSTYETNEDLFNQLKAGGVTYDLVCPSEYMIDKMLQNDMLEKLDGEVSNYQTYGSNYIKNVFAGLSTKDSNGNTVNFEDYAIPYMWGTMGFMYDKSNISVEAVSTYDIIWDENYKNQSSLKDSIRDTYITATLHIYKEELELVKSLYNEGKITQEEYTNHISEVMNRCDDKTITLVEASLKEAKDNIYEFEVDTGKENILKGKYYVNLCWSGDAVYSIGEAAESDFELGYKVPEEGSNIWFDGWVMPKGANKLWAQRLMNFLCDPKIAAMNMDYVGYTSAIAGQEIYDLVYDLYNEDISEDYIDYDLSYFFNGQTIEDTDGNAISDDNYKIRISSSQKDGMLYAQYPDKETIIRCAVMKDFGDQNEKVSEMWIRVKGNSVSWVIIVFLLFVVGIIIFAEVKTSISKRARKRRSKL